ncbi:uncharacterized protein N7482_007767 [Penicillium canariense]|uniref:NACHT domain-containing protein n=1 Tax=Penicillium canariense TaxID=189055 RepID=A0A9W9HXI1_9EURO|nr:uncharacterized protein N7482_007767 [Penicillium canariense]KAJ5160763.1 hypothetical protein N7482_007767 [Penicillium canariense]
MADLTGSDDYNLQGAWDTVCQSFAKTTTVDLTITPRYTIDQVLDQIRQRQDDDEQRNVKYKVAKDVISKTLSCIEVLGGIVAQGASMVFGPSELCFNAVLYLIQTGAKFKGIFSSIAELFKRISDVLERCKIYLRMLPEAVDISLRRIINDELLCFVAVCALSMKVLKGHKILIALKVFAFNTDEGVSEQLARLAELVERESQMRGTLGFESQKNSEKNIVETRDGTKKINAGVDKLLENQRKTEEENKENKQLHDVDTCLDSPSETFAKMRGKYRDLRGKIVDGSGQWLRNDPMYTGWASCEVESPLDVLCISGGEGYGKSYLFTTIIRDLQERDSEVTDNLSRTSIGYYFFEQGSPTRGTAHHDPVYRKELASSAKSMESNQITELWDVLFAKSYKSDSTFFILLDGAERIVRENLKQLLNVLADLQKISDTRYRFRIRILFSARSETVEQITNHLNKGASTIDVASKNKDDIEMFINDRLRSMDILSSGSTQVEALKREILEGLLKEGHGDFVNVGLLLNQIGDKQRPGEIRDVLSRSGEKRSSTIAREIKRLNETLSDDDISDLNELLLWVMNARSSLMLYELEAVLYVKNGELSLRSLENEISGRFSALFCIEGEIDLKTKSMPPTAIISLVSNSIEEYFRPKSPSEEAEADHGQHEWNTTGDVLASEVKIVRRFLDLVCDPNLFKKFEFDAFFERKLTKKTARLGVDTDTAHMQILMACLKAISEKTDGSSPLVDYATFYFEEHLRLIDLSLIQPQSKAVVGPQLVKMFTDEEIFISWWTEDRLWMRRSWLYEDDCVDVVLKWLQDSAVTKKLPENDRAWVKSLSSKSKPDADLLEHIAKFVAHKWLQTSDWDVKELFYWVNAYSNKIASRKDSNVKRETEDQEPKKIPASRIHEVAEWGRQCLGLDSLGYEETRNVARTLRSFEKLDDAVETFKRASSLEEDNWFARWGLAETYKLQGKYALAVETQEAVQASVESGKSKLGNAGNYLHKINRDLALYHKEAGNAEKALDIYESILQEYPDDYQSALAMTLVLHDKGGYTQLIEFLERLKRSKDEVTGLDRRTQIFHEYYWNDDYHGTIAAAGKLLNGSGITTLKDSYRTAVDAAEEKVQLAKDQLNREEEMCAKETMAMLMHHCARFFYNNYTCAEEKEMALSMRVRIIQLDENEMSWYLGRAKLYATWDLSGLYFEKALQAGQGTELAAKYIDDLEHLATLKSDATLTDQTREKYPRQLLARYYARCGNMDKAKNMIRPFVKFSIDLLSDDDPSNDWQGFQGLATHFMFAGQDDNSLAAWSLLIPNQEDEDTDATTELGGPIANHCDGRCRTIWTYANDMYICRECADVQFDEGCLRKLREGTLVRQVCSKSHEMLHVPEYDEEKVKKIGKGNVMVGQEVMPVEDWIQKIKQDWGLSTE